MNNAVAVNPKILTSINFLKKFLKIVFLVLGKTYKSQNLFFFIQKFKWKIIYIYIFYTKKIIYLKKK
jgi:hypothetical protein